MKHLLPILLALLLLLVGCDLRNRQNSENFMPTDTWGNIPHATVLPQAGNSTNQRENSTVKTVLSYEGEIPLSSPITTYSYRLPMIDLAGAQACGCNQEIENRFGTLIRQSMQAMERYEQPTLECLSFVTFTRGDILTLRIDRRDTDGATAKAYYTVNSLTGDAVSVSALFEAAGISGKPEAVLNEAVLELFTSRFGSTEDASTAVTTALNRTQAALSPLTASRMHLTEDGRLTVALELFSPDGGSSMEELLLP